MADDNDVNIAVFVRLQSALNCLADAKRVAQPATAALIVIAEQMVEAAIKNDAALDALRIMQEAVKRNVIQSG